MNIREFSHNLQKLFAEMSDSFSSYQNSTGWNCLSNCGRCCLNPEIEASLHEMIPMALAIYDEGKLDEWVDKLQTTNQDYCLAYLPGSKEGEGKCSRYDQRPSVCRMFGVAGYKNKRNETTLSICKFIKEKYNTTQSPDFDSHKPPQMTEWSFKLASIDQKLIQDRMPINQALMKALEKVSLYAEYQADELRNSTKHVIT